MSDSNVQACAIRFIEDASYWIAALRERELHGIAAAMENLANERDALRAAQLHNRLVIAQHEEHLGRIQDELSESRRLLDEARAQTPVAYMHNKRADVIHTSVKSLLSDFAVNSGPESMLRPIDKAEHYTIPLYAALLSAADSRSPDKCQCNAEGEVTDACKDCPR